MMDKPEFVGEFAAARERLYDLAVEQYVRAKDADEKGFPHVAADYRILAKSFSMASKALAGETFDLLFSTLELRNTPEKLYSRVVEDAAGNIVRDEQGRIGW